MSIRFASKKKLVQLREMAKLFSDWKRALGTDEQFLLRELNVELPLKGDFKLWSQEFETIYRDNTGRIFLLMFGRESATAKELAERSFTVYKKQYYEYMASKLTPVK